MLGDWGSVPQRFGPLHMGTSQLRTFLLLLEPRRSLSIIRKPSLIHRFIIEPLANWLGSSPCMPHSTSYAFDQLPKQLHLQRTVASLWHSNNNLCLPCGMINMAVQWGGILECPLGVGRIPDALTNYYDAKINLPTQASLTIA